MKLLVGTGNKGKLLEITEKFGELPIELKSLKDFPEILQPEETGRTFAENAILKARWYSTQTGLWTLADDSGLEVEALGGLPGVISARYAGVGAKDEDNIRKLLDELKNERNRSARFVCSMAVSDEKGILRFLAEGVCDGIIAFKPRGKNGFGYDSVFIPKGFDKTFGELSSLVKQKISHRARALQKIISFFSDFIGNKT
ncbi:MAG: RdgB/HAM1 family non-canonical purine NTP pyrophosphatase [Pyrinomonadaceae bacterium]|nr:RdgB/HAM1 family non-canonical purine NTP pyrophosphatase [Pyrinomonadaceae bacterium]MCX7639980.1 RdgB/HAM1 family non-canonical purine NTP pyrophosphatase [Pyrinomonadaceae bacterium]MDW8304152.1 RdgB/HAM1 family non-canonical purine NTP pyrophosphatase [Acidobacteriota bacterium]